jgi:hypothetical protein
MIIFEFIKQIPIEIFILVNIIILFANFIMNILVNNGLSKLKKSISLNNNVLLSQYSELSKSIYYMPNKLFGKIFYILNKNTKNKNQKGSDGRNSYEKKH